MEKKVHDHADEATSPSPGESAGDVTTAQPASGRLAWDAPTGWVEKAGTGMRLASFDVGGEDDAGQCTIITLGGAAGGLEANVRRWIGQLGIPAPADEDFRQYLDSQESFSTQGGFPGVLVDLTVLSAAHADAAGSMLAGVITVGEQTVFVKFSGSVPLLNEEKPRFAALCRSLQFEE